MKNVGTSDQEQGRYDDLVRHINEKEAARIMGCSVSKLRNDRFQRRGCPYIKVGNGRKVVYRVSDIMAFLDNGRVDPGASR